MPHTARRRYLHRVKRCSMPLYGAAPTCLLLLVLIVMVARWRNDDVSVSHTAARQRQVVSTSVRILGAPTAATRPPIHFNRGESDSAPASGSDQSAVQFVDRTAGTHAGGEALDFTGVSTPTAARPLDGVRLTGGHKYVAYLPHSGLCNQLNAFINAAMVAHILNRTLLVPPLYMGLQELSWRPFDELVTAVRRTEQEYANYDNKDSNQRGSANVLSFLNRRFLNKTRDSAAIVPFATLFKLDSMPVRMETVSQFFSTSRQQCDKLTSTDDECRRPSIMTVPENVNYQYRLVDRIPDASPFIVDDSHNNLAFIAAGQHVPSPVDKSKYRYMELRRYQLSDKWRLPRNVTRLATYDEPQLLVETAAASSRVHIRRVPLDKFHHMLNLERLASQAAATDILLFGSTFGSSRLYFSAETERRLLSVMAIIRRQLVYNNSPVLATLADRAVAAIGPGASYIGVHVRVGDGSFRLRVDGTLRRMRKLLESRLCLPDQPQLDCLQGPLVIYVATDLPDASESPVLDPLRAVGRVVTLDGLYDEAVAPAARDIWAQRRRTPLDKAEFAISRVLELLSPPLKSMANTTDSDGQNNDDDDDDLFDGKGRLKSFWAPILDQMIACRGSAVLGTSGSTFSAYIEQLHSAYWSSTPTVAVNSRPGGWILGKV